MSKRRRGTYIIVDMSSVCYSGAFAYPRMYYQSYPTGVFLHFFVSVSGLANRYKTNRFVLCWDSKKSHRKRAYPEYKAGRHRDIDPEMARTFAEARYQMEDLRRDLCPRLGFANSFRQTGVESDDLIAQTCKQLGDAPKIIVSGDRDLYQCLDYNTVVVSKVSGKEYSAEDFQSEYGIPPKDWAEVLSIAGCATDNVVGVSGVSVKRAIQYLNGTLKGKALASVVDSVVLIERNRGLVRLPHVKTRPVQLRDEQYCLEFFVETFEKYGLESQLNKRQFWKVFSSAKGVML